METVEKIGFIGLGIMGRGMVQNLLKAGHTVQVWNRTPSWMRLFEQYGATTAQSPAELAAQCNILMICISDTPDVEEVVCGKYGVLEGLRPNTIIIDHSTISPKATRILAEQVANRGSQWLDAPVSGGAEGAKNGTLSVMVGGDEPAYTRVKPYLQAYSKIITHVGASGAGQMVKLVNQVLVVVNQLAVSEALLFAQAGGLDLEKTLQAVQGGAGGSWMLSTRGPQMLVRDWRPGFTIDLQQKDLRLVLECADELGLPMLATSLVYQLYRSLQNRGLGGDGNHALVKALEHLAGLEIGQ
jgi:3-hydroxyisobutyrate dehydrogenase